MLEGQSSGKLKKYIEKNNDIIIAILKCCIFHPQSQLLKK